YDIWIWEFANRTLARFTLHPADDGYPVWSPDSNRIVFRTLRNGPPALFWQAADGGGQAERLGPADPNAWRDPAPFAFSPDGKQLVFSVLAENGAPDLLMYSLADGSTRALTQTPFGESNADIAPDGRWMAY